MLAGLARGQDARKVPISFLPPPLENATYSVGIYVLTSNHLVRHLHEIALEKDFTVGLNGLVTSWDGKDDDGKSVPPGQYVARGFAVGPLKVEGVGMRGNDWSAEDENLRVKHVDGIALAPDNDDLLVAATLVAGKGVLLRLACSDGSVVWKRELPEPPAAKKEWSATPDALRFVKGEIEVRHQGGKVSHWRLSDGLKLADSADPGTPLSAGLSPQPPPEDSDPSGAWSEGRDGTAWVVGNHGLYQLPKAADAPGALRKIHASHAGEDSVYDEAARALLCKWQEPFPMSVAASTTHDRLYLLEEMPGWQRLRGLFWLGAKEEDGHPVSTWQTFFERNIRTPNPDGVPWNKGNIVTGGPNPLSPFRAPKILLGADFDARGSYLTANGGLRLRRISERANLEQVYLRQSKVPGILTFEQYDGAITDEFSISGSQSILEFDAGIIEMGADGEKTHHEKPVEPPDL